MSVPPDYIALALELKTLDPDYEKMMELASERYEVLGRTCDELGFAEDAMKTVDYEVSTETKQIRHENGDYERVFVGYSCEQTIDLYFDFDADRLTQVMTAISRCAAKPLLSVGFTVKDPEAVREELLRSATRNARQKAEILADEAGVKLGQLISINYDWADIQFYSPTSVSPRQGKYDQVLRMSARSIHPENIKESDNAAFVWEIG